MKLDPLLTAFQVSLNQKPESRIERERWEIAEENILPRGMKMMALGRQASVLVLKRYIHLGLGRVEQIKAGCYF